MSVDHLSELPDPVLGSVVAAHNPTRTLRARVNAAGDHIEINVGPVYLSMSVRNWVQVIAAVQDFEVQAPQRQFSLVFDDDDAAARMVQL